MLRIRLDPAAAAVLAVLLLSAAGCVSPEGQAIPHARAAALAADRGCDSCHALKASPLGKGPIPIAPAWQEIAARYRSNPAAEGELVAVILGGTEERHWKGEPLVSMLPHEPWVAPEEARALARWILAL